AMAASVGSKVPDMKFSAVSRKTGMPSIVRAELFKGITRQSFANGNPPLHNFLEVWTMLSHGTIFEYEGYQTGGAKIKRVKSFDSITGDIEIIEEWVARECKPYSVILNPQEFYWWDMYIRDIQDQPHIAWIQHYTYAELEREFGKFANFKHVRDKQTAAR